MILTILRTIAEVIGWGCIALFLWSLLRLPIYALSFTLCEMIAVYPHPDTRWWQAIRLPVLWWQTIKRFWLIIPDEISSKAYRWNGPFSWSIKRQWWL